MIAKHPTFEHSTVRTVRAGWAGWPGMAVVLGVLLLATGCDCGSGGACDDLGLAGFAVDFARNVLAALLT